MADNIQRLIESAARLSVEVDPRNPPNQMFQASIAISLKRIADMLERVIYAEGNQADLSLSVRANCDVRQA